jgi:hypothetical protein
MIGKTKLIETFIGILNSIIFELFVISLSWFKPSFANFENLKVKNYKF